MEKQTREERIEQLKKEISKLEKEIEIADENYSLQPEETSLKELTLDQVSRNIQMIDLLKDLHSILASDDTTKE